MQDDFYEDAPVPATGSLRERAAGAIAATRQLQERRAVEERARHHREAAERLRMSLKSWLGLDVSEPIEVRPLDRDTTFAFVTVDDVTLGLVDVRSGGRGPSGPGVWIPCECGDGYALLGSAEGWDALGETLEKSADGLLCVECWQRVHAADETFTLPVQPTPVRTVTPVEYRLIRALIDLIESCCPAEEDR